MKIALGYNFRKTHTCEADLVRKDALQVHKNGKVSLLIYEKHKWACVDVQDEELEAMVGMCLDALPRDRAISLLKSRIRKGRQP